MVSVTRIVPLIVLFVACGADDSVIDQGLSQNAGEGGGSSANWISPSGSQSASSGAGGSNSGQGGSVAITGVVSKKPASKLELSQSSKDVSGLLPTIDVVAPGGSAGSSGSVGGGGSIATGGTNASGASAGATTGGTGGTSAGGSGSSGVAGSGATTAGAGGTGSLAGTGGTGTVDCWHDLVPETQPTSCNGGLLGCGVDAQDDCCRSVVVGCDSVLMGRSESGADQCPDNVFKDSCLSSIDDQPEFSAYVHPLRLDVYEVTVGRFRRFVDDYDSWRGAGNPVVGDGSHPVLSGTGWAPEWTNALPASAAEIRAGLPCEQCFTWTDQPGPNEDMPITCVTWFEAMAFCIWDGGRLPLETEWELAAAGADENRLYPWGAEAPTDALANFRPDIAGSVCSEFIFDHVGFRKDGQGRFGHLDLAGNAKEWCFDRYEASWFTSVNQSCSDGCVNAGADLVRVVRGGGYTSVTNTIRSAKREMRGASDRARQQGIRCARLSFQS